MKSLLGIILGNIARDITNVKQNTQQNTQLFEKLKCTLICTRLIGTQKYPRSLSDCDLIALKINNVSFANLAAFATFHVAVYPDAAFGNSGLRHAPGMAETHDLQELVEFDKVGVC
jgi:hypothetical protein